MYLFDEFMYKVSYLASNYFVCVTVEPSTNLDNKPNPPRLVQYIKKI